MIKREFTVRAWTETLLIYYLAIAVGAQGLFLGLIDYFLPQDVAQYLHWENGPFLALLGWANTSYGLLGILSVWNKGGWRSATALGNGFFRAMGAFTHYLLNDINLKSSFEKFGPTFLSDTIIAVGLFTLLFLRYKFKKHRAD